MTKRERKRVIQGRSHIVIPDMQCRPGLNFDHCEWIGRYVADRSPDVLVCLGDWWDMPSLSSYDRGKKSFEGRRYAKDIEAGREAMDRLLAPIKRLKRRPRMVFTVGNHEERIHRAVEDNAQLEGVIGYDDLGLSGDGWEVYDFLELVEIDGVTYSHFFPRSASGAISQAKRGAPNARAQLVRQGGSCTAGHQQGLDVSCVPLRGRLQWGLICGSAYRHDESYLSPQGTTYWRGVVVKHGVKDGTYNPMFVDLAYLKRRYG